MISTTPGAQAGVDPRGVALPAGTLRVLQLTDTHLFAEPDASLLGIDTLESFRRVVAHFRAQHWPVDLLIATGDLVHDASPAGYRRLADMLSSFGVPVFAVPGNHDDPDLLRACLKGPAIHTETVRDLNGWRFVMLDSVIPGRPGGRLDPAELDRLAQALASTDRHVLLCLHHQPVAVGSAWIDTMAVEDPAPLFDIVDRHANVRGILWGHVHQTFDRVRNGVRLMASPSTCVQFAPGADSFKVDEEPPGFRWLALLPDGEIRSEVVRVTELPRGIELASSGY
jgi:Icc protein